MANQLTYNWDNKLRAAQFDSNSVSLRYDPAGNRIRKESSVSGTRKYIVDTIGDLPVILLELDNSGNIVKIYIYANSQILAQHDGSYSASRYFYLHDRLGSVRQIINSSANVVNYYTYNPFGETLEITESITNPWRFTGQYYDSEIDLYYLRNRQYHPHIYRFTTRDLVAGNLQEPLSLHKYLYCRNDPVNKIDPSGLWDKETHDWFIDLLFPLMFEKDKDFVKQGSALMDEVYDAPEYAYMHAMLNGKEKNPDVWKARDDMMKFVNDTLDLAKKMRSQGLNNTYYFDLGMALHPLMDATSPLHMGFQKWNGYGSFSSYPHLWKEGKDDVTLDIQIETIRSLQEIIYKFDWNLMTEYSYGG